MQVREGLSREPTEAHVSGRSATHAARGVVSSTSQPKDNIAPPSLTTMSMP